MATRSRPQLAAVRSAGPAGARGDEDGGGAYLAPALEKGLDILELLSARRVALNQAEIARALDRTGSEVFRMLVVLERRGYIVKDSSGRYGLTLRLLEMAHGHGGLEKLLAVAEEPMRRLAEELGESCHLGVLRNGRLLVVARSLSPSALRLSVEVGATFAIEETTSGRLLAALLADDAYEASFGAPKPRELAHIARQDHLDEPSHVLEGVENISVPIRMPGETAALTICLIAGRSAERRAVVVRRALDCAEEIRRTLGLDHRL
jgi:DNA-binding IclR family transcriptional regulator